MAAQPTVARAGRISPGVATRAAWSLGIVAVVMTAFAMALVVATRSVSRPAWERPWQLVLLSIAWYLPFSAVGVIIAARRPANPLGWLLLAIGLAVGWVSTWNWAIMVPVLPFVFLLFPDGRLPSPRWGVLAWRSAYAAG